MHSCMLDQESILGIFFMMRLSSVGFHFICFLCSNGQWIICLCMCVCFFSAQFFPSFFISIFSVSCVSFLLTGTSGRLRLLYSFVNATFSALHRHSQNFLPLSVSTECFEWFRLHALHLFLLFFWLHSIPDI